MPATPTPSPERIARFRRGRTAEWLAAAYLISKGHRVLARRFKAPTGEIDLITLRAGRIAFIEVKRRSTLEDCQASITPRLRQRVRRAADVWLARNPRFQDYEMGFDIVFIRPRTWPAYLRDAL